MDMVEAEDKCLHSKGRGGSHGSAFVLEKTQWRQRTRFRTRMDTVEVKDEQLCSGEHGGGRI